jgi:predicted metalloprotease
MAVGGGLGAIVVVVAAFFLGVDPSILLDALSGDQSQQQTQTQPQTRPGGPAPSSGAGSSRPPDAGHSDTMRQFVSVVLADTEDVWRQAFRAWARLMRIPSSCLLELGASPCGWRAPSGPFLPERSESLSRPRSSGPWAVSFPGEFAEAYVIAHEIGHHVQGQLGFQKATAERGRVDQRQSNAISVRVELQADCLAGVWANHADRAKHIIEKGDVEAALNAASSVGDDHLQRQTRGTVMPDAFTHGSSAQRVHWFKRGLETGSLKACDTFAAEKVSG